jgi:hypothetical protein
MNSIACYCRPAMSFFNLTLMGYDNQFKSMKHLDSAGNEHANDVLRKVPPAGPSKSALEKQLAREMTGDLQSREWTTPAVSNL